MRIPRRAYAKLNKRDPQLMEHIARAAEPILDSFKPQEISNMTYAFAKTQSARGSEFLFASIAKQVTRRVEEFGPQDVSNTLWAFAASDAPLGTDFSLLARRSSRGICGIKKWTGEHLKE